MAWLANSTFHRWYDPAVGRWLSEDPLGLAAGDANLYRYVGNSPLTHTDPLESFKGSGVFLLRGRGKRECQPFF